MRALVILGWRGGVARGLLGILDQALGDPDDPLHEFLRTAVIHGVDRELPENILPDRSLALRERFRPRTGNAGDESFLSALLAETECEVLVDLTGLDCRAAMNACARAGTRYLNSAIEITGNMACEPVRILEEMEIFQRFRESTPGLRGIVGAGMNPGVVQWLALELIRRAEGRTPLACYVVEHDTTFFRDPSRAREDTVYTTWSPAGFLYEAVHSRPIFMRARTPVALFDEVYRQEFLVRLGDRSFHGHLMPHEEVLNLGRLFDMETAFLYRVNDFSCRVLEGFSAGVDRDEPECFTLNAANDELAGTDTVGVLLVYPDHELYAFNSLATPDIYTRFGTNATYFQVACGTAAALTVLLRDEIPPGVYYVDELLLETPAGFGEYLGRYLKDFTFGRNESTDGLLFDRMRKINHS